MELTVLTKAKHDALLAQIQTLQFDVNNLTTQIAMANSQLHAIQNCNNQLAEIAFDENKFTQQLMDRVEEVARKTAKDAIDLDDIANEVQDNIDTSEDVQRCIDRMDLVTEDKVNDIVEEYVNDNNLLDTDEVEEVVEDYLRNNDYLVRDDVEDVVRDVVNEIVDERTENVARRIAKEVIKEEILALVNKLTAKENTDADNSRDTSIQVSGTIGEGETRSYNAASA